MGDFKDQRAAERFSVSPNSVCEFVSPVLEDFGPARLFNISTDGVGLITTEPLSPGLLLAIKVVNASKKFSRTMLVRVAHCTAQAGGTYLIGGSFDAPLTYEELCTLVL